ncbi:probable palmitoyltransferase ZDHHC24 [Achroia grisella]|uniref:probable palmitoyltransferase ZDHHC24 n=1 Tax=Achroia grisella TaxID=688607 RepID=UPI0027D302B5|nr:probable palmitoyltransferase ZDHHC24 [Achroia grisella]
MNIITRNCIKKPVYTYEKVQCVAILFILIPGYFIFEMVIVKPTLVKMFEMAVVKHSIHVILSIFCYINVSGNMLMAIATDASSKNNVKDGIYCKFCNRNRSQRSWHCRTCNVCILGRDHHCFFFSTCIGLYNRRYYILFLFYIIISMLYSSYYNYYYVSSKLEEHGFMISVFRIINPLLRFITPEPMSVVDLYVLFFLLNILLLVWITVLFCFHMRNVTRGVTTHESKNISTKRSIGWKNNLLSVFGRRWYFAILWPFIESPLSDFIREETD